MAQGIDALLASIIATVYQNSNGDIDGQDLQDRLVDMVDSLNQASFDPLIPYNEGQQIIYNNGGVYTSYLCITDTTPGEDPISVPAKWTITSALGVDLSGIELSIADLKAVTGYVDDDQILVNNNNGLYGFSSVSTDTPDDDLVVLPDDITLPDPGRWLKLKTLVDTSTTGSLSNLTTPITTTLVDALNDIAKSGVEVVQNITALKAIILERRANKVVCVQYYDEGDEGASSGGVKRALFYKGDDFVDITWEDLANWQQIEPIVTTEFTSTISLGGVSASTTYPVGTTLESIIVALLTPYVQSAISTFTVENTPSGLEFEVGATVEIDSVTVAVDNDSAGDPPVTLNVAGTGFNTSVNVGVNPPASTTEITNTSDVDEDYVCSGTDANSDPINEITVSLKWLFRHFVGASDTELTALSTDLEATTLIDLLQISSLAEGREAIVDLTTDFGNVEYFTYIAFASTYGDLEQITYNNGDNILDAFEKVADFNYTNSEGHIESYSIYKTNAPGAFANGDNLIIV